MADRTQTSEPTAERAPTTGDAASSLVEPVVVGAVVGGLANLIDTDVLFPGWGVLAGAAIGLGCGLVFRGRDADDHVAPAATARDRGEAARKGSTAADVATPVEPEPAEPAPDAAVTSGDDKARSGVGGAKARVIARSSGRDADDEGSAEPAPATTLAKESSASTASKERKEPKVVPKAAIVSARPLAPSTASTDAASDDFVEVAVLGAGGTGVAATGRARGDRVRRVALAEATRAGAAGSQWSELLVDGFTSSADGSCTDPVPFGRVLSVGRTAWTTSHESEAASSFVGLEVVDVADGGAWRAVAAGTCVLLVVRKGKVVARLPSTTTDAADPIPSVRSDGDLLRRSNGTLASGDVVLLCAARVADWVGANATRVARLVDLDDRGASDLADEIAGDGSALVVRVRIR